MVSTYIYAVQEAVFSAAEQKQGSLMDLMPMVVMMMLATYFIFLRPQQKKDRERRDMLAGLSKGDHIVTTGGIQGKIIFVDESKVVLKVSDDPVVKIEFVRSAIAHVVQDEEK